MADQDQSFLSANRIKCILAVLKYNLSYMVHHLQYRKKNLKIVYEEDSAICNTLLIGAIVPETISFKQNTKPIYERI